MRRKTTNLGIDQTNRLKWPEREGFEPSIRTSRIPDFESGAFDHSAISPHSERVILTEQDPFCFFDL